MIIIEPKSGSSVLVRKGEILRVTDIEGAQVADLVCFNAENYGEFFSQAKTRLNNEKVRITTGDKLFSSMNNVMFTIVEDKVGMHDLLFAPCNSYYYESVAKIGAKNGCLENLAAAVQPYGIPKNLVPAPFNIFMHTSINEAYELHIHEPLSKKGDYIDLQAEMDCLVAVSSCSDESECNGGICTSIKLEVLK